MSDKPHPAAIDVAGIWYLRDAKGSLVPLTAVKPVDLLIDELVRLELTEAREISADLASFKQRSFSRVGELQALLAQEYGATIGGAKGNITLPAFDGCGKVQVASADLRELGPELQVAKQLIDECLLEWSAESHEAIRALVNRVFSVDKEGQISHAGLFMLLRVEIHDERWQRAMDAIRDSIRVIGSRTYIRFYDRNAPDAGWVAIPLDLASA
ncbi:sulfate transporter [Sphingomonas metalli]|uniref:Sulfate transporter n=1 Tax=Sphingomonas metalli TaxID=1779358 RepID=A0A916SX47_9SPHN|nr:DUF3164 family protein [Sphingomonas metalli]GGB21396.1 sulfate transporter [Sphingomonas metalli]